VDLAIEGKRRLITLNDSYNKKYIYYTNIVIILVFTLLIYLGIVFLKSRLAPNSSTALYDILTILLFSGSAIWCGYIVLDIRNRDHIQFDELDSNASSLLSPDIFDHSGNLGTGTISQSFDFGASCVGPRCCPAPMNFDTEQGICVDACRDGSKWNASTNSCVQTFTTFSIEKGSNKGNTAVSGSSLPFEPSEFANYSKI
jgi:hypothetical protein